MIELVYKIGVEPNPKKTVEAIILLMQSANRYINETEFWNMKNQEEAETVVVTLCEALRSMAVLMWPVMPRYSEKLFGLFGTKAVGPNGTTLKDCKIELRKDRPVKLNMQAKKNVFIKRIK